MQEDEGPVSKNTELSCATRSRVSEPHKHSSDHVGKTINK